MQVEGHATLDKLCTFPEKLTIGLPLKQGSICEIEQENERTTFTFTRIGFDRSCILKTNLYNRFKSFELDIGCCLID